MRRALAVAVVVLAVGAGLAVWLGQDPPPPALPTAEADVPSIAPVAIAAAPGQPSYTLTGTVRDAAGKPVPGAQVFVSASSQGSLATLRCLTCNEPLLSCHAHPTTQVIGRMLEAHQGELVSGATATTDAEGKFRFERLAGISFTVWARAAGFGAGIKERAAPGEPVELYLPARRRITGRLRDDNGAPVQGEVRALSRRLAQAVVAKAEADGQFALDELGEGPFYVLATAPGKLPAALRDVEAGPEPVSLTLLAPRRLEVTLLKDKKPIDGTVMLSADHLSRALPSKDGLMAVDALYPGKLLVSAVAGSLSSSPQAVSLDALVTKVTLNLEPGGLLHVTVNDEAGEPVPDPSLEVLTASGEQVLTRKLKTGEAPTLGPLGTGDYVVRATALGFQPGSVPLALKAQDNAVEVTLTRGFVIAGRVIDEYGRPAPGVSVLISPLGDTVIADADGRFSSNVPSAGLYTLQAHHSDWGGGELKVTAPKTDVELQLEPKAAAEIVVTVDGRRVEGANAVLIYPEGNFRSDRPSGADGIVLMRGLPPGPYTLVVLHSEYLPSERQDVTLEDGVTKKLSAELKSGAAVTGRVVDTLGAPVAGVSVSLVPRAAEPQVTDGNGAFTLKPLRAKAPYAVRVQQRGYEQLERTVAIAGGEPVKVVVKRQPIFRGRVLGDGQPLKHFRVDEFEVNSADGRFELSLPASEDRVIVTVEAPGFETLMADRPNTPELGDLELTRAPMVSGLVRDEAGNPVPDAVVSCDTCEQSVTSQLDGRFQLGRPSYQREFTVVAKKGRRTATKTVAADATTGIELVLKPGVRLLGRAYLPNGQPAAGVEIAGIHVDRSETVSVVTGADGSYSVELAPGIYRLMLNAWAYARQAVDPPASIIDVQGPETRLDLGVAPDQPQLTVRLQPRPGWALWLLKGDVSRVGNPPFELLRASWAQLVFQPRQGAITFGSLQPGRYTVVWGSFHASGDATPVLMSVTVPGQAEVVLPR